MARIQVAKFPVHEAAILKSSSSGHWNMEEDEVLDRLYDNSSQNRFDTLEQLIITVKRTSGRLPFDDPCSIFKGLTHALSDSNWDIRLKCIQLLNEVIPRAEDDLDECMTLVVWKLIPNIGDPKICVKRAVIQTLHLYLKYTQNVPALIQSIVKIGLENEDTKVMKETISALPVILTKEFAHENFYDIIQSLCKKLFDTSAEDNLQDSSLFTLRKIEELVGEKKFRNYIQKLSAPLRKYYLQLADISDTIVIETPRSVSNTNSNSNTPRNNVHASYSRKESNTSFPRNEFYSGAGNPYNRNEFSSVGGFANGRETDSYEFGIVPSHVMNHINDQENFRTRAQAVEDLKRIMKELNNAELNTYLMPHMLAFISFLNNLLDDPNFKIPTVTLEILCSLVEKLGQNVKQFLRPLISALAKRMYDNKIVIRQAVMMVAIKMMQSYSAKPVLAVIAEHLHHKNSRVRQETINIIIASLLTFPSYEFDLAAICQFIGPCLTDSKRQVRQAALECFSVLAQAMGSGHLQPLVQVVDQVELSSDGEGLMAAVQARLARKQLPRLNTDGLVEYATPIPSSATQRSSTLTQGADVEWILSVSGTGSARSSRTDPHMELESVNSSARNTPSAPETPTPVPRRFMSAGRGRNKFPWEEEKDEWNSAYSTMPGSAPIQAIDDASPTKARTTWTVDSEMPPDPRRVPKRRSTVMGIDIPDDSEASGSYKQIYQNKLRRQQNAAAKSTNFESGDASFSVQDIKENGFHRPDHKTTPRPFLDPISDEDETPINLKPTLARGSATRRLTPKVPPISTSSSPSYPRDDDADSAYSASVEGSRDDSQDEMLNSLRKIRHSASKKKAEKIFEKLEKQSSRQSMSSSPPLSDNFEESGVFSSYSKRDGEVNKKKGKKIESPFEARPKLARNGSIKKKDSFEMDEKGNTTQNYNPLSGATFRENKTSDVQIVGKGYSDDSSTTTTLSDRSTTQLNSVMKTKDRKRVTKGSTVSPLGVSSPYGYGTIEIDDDKVPSQDNIALVGKGMFDTQSNSSDNAINNGFGVGKVGRPHNRNDVKAVPSGVIGVRVKQNSDPYNDILGAEDDVGEDMNSTFTKTLKERIAQKQKQKEEEEERRRAEKERKRQEHEEKLKREKERQQEKLRRLSSSGSMGLESLTISGSNSSSNLSSVSKGNAPKPMPPAVTPRNKIKTSNEPVSSLPMSAAAQSPVDDNPADWQPFKDPDGALREAQKKITNEDWEMKISAIILLRRLMRFHPETLNSQLHAVLLLVLNEVKNLRSQVSRAAILGLGDMFLYLKKSMEPDLDMAARGLLAKSCETNAFIRADVETALMCMVDNANPQRALVALISGGASHKSTAVRKVTAQYLAVLVERMGPGKILSGIKDITDRIIPTVAQFVSDGSQDTRYYGRKMLSLLMRHPDFDKMLTKHLPSNTLRHVQDVVENLRQKGLGDVPNETSSARSRKSGQGSRAGSSVRGGSASSSVESVTTTPVPKRRPMNRTDENTMEEIKQIMAKMSATDWKERDQGISDLQDICQSNPGDVGNHIVKIFDRFLPRLQDANSKVNRHALEVMQGIIPLLKDYLGAVISLVVSHVVPNLSSKNTDIYNLASDILQTLIEYLDPVLLINPFSNQALNANARSKSDMVLKVAYLVDCVYQKKPKQIVLHVLPLLWHLLGTANNSGDLHNSIAALVNVLHKHMGPALLDKANSVPGVTTRQLQLLQDYIERR
ncbi:TOG array regulator of axonemal microtubules protein 1-like isoform X2 [Gigantopelta aegis]|uniref:TOG array regulator of axonemal microtubules protein 1-like isoform X2 n=1 Tax=Gigantopelta aegis TaxID=1735272 RepID=UPI001B88B6BB|nr:TOG array regulator of axonemal microtubules protein 1-like isoform X2 [Gigantopelta aegis]